MEINLKNTIREEEVHWPEYGVFQFFVLQIVIFPYITFNLSVFKYFPIRSNFKESWRFLSDFNKPTCLYLLQIYTLNFFIFCQFVFTKNVFVDVSCIVKCEKIISIIKFYKIIQNILL
jgi:hypothetical protein